MGKLEKSICYLSGPMDRAPDGGENWRIKAQAALWEMGIGVFNPCDKPYNGPTEKELRDKRTVLKEFNDFDGIRRQVRGLIGVDLRMLDLSSLIIMYVNPDIHTCGTYWECCYAVQQHKPILTFCEQGRKFIPDWLLGMISNEHLFQTLGEVMQFIKNVNDGMPVDGKYWKFFNWDKVFNRSAIG